MSNRRFIRFETLKRHADTGVPGGLFTVVDDFREDSAVSEADFQRFEVLGTWFADNLVRPDKFSSSRRKSAGRGATRGISWFKPEATEHIAKARELIALVQEYGYYTRQVETSRPGKIVYEDEHQIVAESFSDTRKLAGR